MDGLVGGDRLEGLTKRLPERSCSLRFMFEGRMVRGS